MQRKESLEKSAGTDTSISKLTKKISYFKCYLHRSVNLKAQYIFLH